MEAATVRSKGRLTIPAKVRQALAIHAGDLVEFVELERGKFLLGIVFKTPCCPQWREGW